ncbi:MAG: hypothetical protein LBL90_14000 [Prevotellaceae bacterium]|nr:hypothetical protein [Prevotellaceae bacterium]
MSFELMRGRRAPNFGSSMPAVGIAAKLWRLFGANGNENSQRLEKNLSDSGVSCGSIAGDDWDSFATAFKGGNHRAGKKYTVGTEGNTCRLRHRIRRAFRKTCYFSKIIRERLNVFK